MDEGPMFPSNLFVFRPPVPFRVSSIVCFWHRNRGRSRPARRCQRPCTFPLLQAGLDLGHPFRVRCGVGAADLPLVGHEYGHQFHGPGRVALFVKQAQVPGPKSLGALVSDLPLDRQRPLVVLDGPPWLAQVAIGHSQVA
jgi:hypothetical protein